MKTNIFTRGIVLLLALLMASCLTIPPHQNSRPTPPDLNTARKQVQLYAERSQRHGVNIIEKYAQALLDEHLTWMHKSIVEFEARANSYDSAEAFEVTGNAAVAVMVTSFPFLAMQHDISYLRAGKFKNTPALLELLAIRERLAAAERAGTERRAEKLRIVRMQNLAATTAARDEARQERLAKFDTPRRRLEQCKDSGKAKVGVEPTEAEMCGALLSDFDWRAKGAEETVGPVEEFFFGSSPEKIRVRGSLLVTISNFKKHGKCSRSTNDKRHGYTCTYSATVDYNDHAIMIVAQAMSGGKPKSIRVQGFFYIGESGKWETDQK
ncbi:MAG: hypothetical protein ACOY7P_15575 [Pseudomonadota bacterium]